MVHSTVESNKRERTLNLSGAKVQRTDLSYANLTRANLTGANLSHAILRGANMKDAILDGAILIGADLRDVKNLTKAQVAKAVIDESTLLPDYLSNE